MEEQLIFVVKSVADGVDRAFDVATSAINDLGEAYEGMATKEADVSKSLTQASEKAKKAAYELAQAKVKESQAVLEAAQAKLKDIKVVQEDAQAHMDYAKSLLKSGQDRTRASMEYYNAEQELKRVLKEVAVAEEEVRQATDAHVKTVDQAVKTAQQYANAQEKASKAAQERNNATSQQVSAEKAAQQSAVATVAALGALYATYRAITSALNEATQAYVANRNAMVGLQSIAEGTGNNMGRINKEINALIDDGLMPLESATLGLKNLLSRGFSIEEAVDIMNRLKDSAAFGRQAHLELGEAVATATEGLKNENSVLVDNAGVTKNVSAMWKDYAAEIGKGVQELTLAEKRQAEYNGIMEETRHQVGDAKKLAGEFAGSQASLTAQTTRLQVALGKANAQGMQPFTNGLTKITKGLADFAEKSNPVLTGLMTFIRIGGGAIILLLGLSGGFRAVGGAIISMIPGIDKVRESADRMWTSITGPVGIVVGVITTVISVFSGLSAASERAREEIAALNDEIRDLVDTSNNAAAMVARFSELEAKGSLRSKEETAEMNRISEELVASYGFRADGVNEEGKRIATNIELMNEQLRLQRENIRLKLEESYANNDESYKKAVEGLEAKKQKQIELNELNEQYLQTVQKLEHKANTIGFYRSSDYDDLSLNRELYEKSKGKLEQVETEIKAMEEALVQQVNNSVDLAVLTAQTRGKEIPAELQNAMYTAMQELQSQDTTGTAVSADTGMHFIERYFEIGDEAALAESKVAEIQNLKNMILAQLAVSDMETEQAGGLAQQLLGNLADEGALAQGMEQGKLLRQKIDQGIATQSDKAAYNQMRNQVQAEINQLINLVKQQGQQLGLPTDGIVDDLLNLRDAFSQTADDIANANIQEKVADMSMDDFISEMESAMDAASNMRAELADWADLQSAIDVVNAGADATDYYSDALTYLAERYGVTEEQALANMDAYQADANATKVLMDMKLALAEVEVNSAIVTAETMIGKAGVTAEQSARMVDSLKTVRDELEALNGMNISLDPTETGAEVNVTGGGKPLNPFRGGSPSWVGRFKPSGGGARRSSGGGRGSSRGASSAAKAQNNKNEALERELALVERLKKLDQLTTREEIANLQRILAVHAKTAEEREKIELQLYDLRKKQAQDDLAYKRAMDRLTQREELNAIRNQMAQFKAGTDARRELEKQEYALRKEVIRSEYELDVHYGRLTLEQQRVRLQQQLTMYRRGTQARIEIEKEIAAKTEEIQQRDANMLDSLAEAIKSAVRNRYEEQRRREEERINASIKAWGDWGNAQQEAIQKQIQALDDLTSAEDKAEQERKKRRDIEATRQKLQYETDAYNRRKLQEELARQEDELNKWLARNQRDDLKKQLNEQSQAISKRVQEEQNALSEQLAANQRYYESLTTEAQLNAEAKRYLSDDEMNPRYISTLLKNYLPEYNALGKSLGEQLVDGFRRVVGNIPKWFENLHGHVSKYQEQMAKVANQEVLKYWANRGDRGQQHVAPYIASYKEQAPVLHVYFNQPIESPAEVSRELERLMTNMAKT